jgi:hypothetical protein
LMGSSSSSWYVKKRFKLVDHLLQFLSLTYYLKIEINFAFYQSGSFTYQA